MEQRFYRGKVKHNSDETEENPAVIDGWVYGYLVYLDSQPYIVGPFVETDEEYTILEYWVPVIEESVGQETGLYDSNGNMIYEGDILKSKTNMLADYKIESVEFVSSDDPKTLNERGIVARGFSGYWLNGGYSRYIIGNTIDDKELIQSK